MWNVAENDLEVVVCRTHSLGRVEVFREKHYAIIRFCIPRPDAESIQTLMVSKFLTTDGSLSYNKAEANKFPDMKMAIAYLKTMNIVATDKSAE